MNTRMKQQTTQRNVQQMLAYKRMRRREEEMLHAMITMASYVQARQTGM